MEIKETGKQNSLKKTKIKPTFKNKNKTKPNSIITTK